MGAVVERLVGGEVLVEVDVVVVVVMAVVVVVVEGAGAVVGMAVVIARVESETERSCPGMEREMQTDDRQPASQTASQIDRYDIQTDRQTEIYSRRSLNTGNAKRPAPWFVD